jgi:hypothetical protein
VGADLELSGFSTGVSQRELWEVEGEKLRVSLSGATLFLTYPIELCVNSDFDVLDSKIEKL